MKNSGDLSEKKYMELDVCSTPKFLVADESTSSKNLIVLPTPHELRKDLPLTKEIFLLQAEKRHLVRQALRDQGCIVIVGPCSLHHLKGSLDYADRLADLQYQLPSNWIVLMRCYFEKSRSAGGWKGLLHGGEGRETLLEGIQQTRWLLREILNRGLGTAAELISPYAVPYVEDLLTWGSIGARTVTSQIHRELASGLPFPIGFKNCLSGDVQTALEAVLTATQPHSRFALTEHGQIIGELTPGNRDAHIVLRGGYHGPNLSESVLEQIQRFTQPKNICSRVIVDCSHGNSRRNPTQQRTILLNAKNYPLSIAGFMLESYLQGGFQPDQGQKSTPTISITDPCLSWNETKILLLEAAELSREISI